jgi:iron complex transport system ATP-binding protein
MSGLVVEKMSWGPTGGPLLLRDISFKVAPGERLAIIGPNSSGKTSLLRCLAGVNTPTSGSVKLEPQARVASLLQEPAFELDVHYLSRSERQRMALARLMIGNPSLLILDEPTTHLDVKRQLEVLQDLKRSGLTVITTLQDINLAANFADHIAVLSGGRLIAYGRPRKVLTNMMVGEAFGVQANRYAASVGPGPQFFFWLPRKQAAKEVV